MEILDEVQQQLQEKAELFLRYEKETETLLSDDPEDVDRIVCAVDNRQEIIDEIRGIDINLEVIRDTSGQGLRCYDIVKNKCDYSQLNEKERILFDEAQQIFSTITRIQELEARAAVSMDKIRSFLQDKIKQSNTNVKFSGYLKQIEQKSTGMLYNKKR